MNDEELKKIIEKAKENDGGWLDKLPIIKEVANFPKDEHTNELCTSCKANCCFFDEIMTNTIFGEYDFKLDGLENRYKNFDAVQDNAKRMFRKNSYDTIDWFTHWVGNSDWTIVVKWSGGISVGYACPMLNEKMKCSIYPNRPEICKDAYKTKKKECLPDVIAMFKEGNLIYI